MNNHAPEFTRILAIDYGLRRIGLALSDPLKTFSYPHDTIQNDTRLMVNLTKLIKEQAVERIILGYPTKEDGSNSHITADVIKFKAELEKALAVEVILWDERYSSSIAKDLILKSVTKRGKRRDKGLVDRGAAAVILQEYLDSI